MFFKIARKFFGAWMIFGNLTKKRKTCAHATFVGSVFQIWKMLIEIVTHFVGEFD